MTRIARTLPAFALAVALAAPVAAGAPSAVEGQQQIDDLRRRVEEVERQLFQQRLAAPPSPQAQALQALQYRIEALERQMASERISRVAAEISSRPSPPAPDSAGKQPQTLEARIELLETQRAEDAKTIAALAERVAKLEKAAVK